MGKLITGARVPLSMVKQHEQLMSSLVNNINGVTGRFVIHLSMKTIASLSEHYQNKQILFSFSGLLESIALGTAHMSEAVRDESVRVIMNLAFETKNKSRLIQENERYWIDVVLHSTAGSLDSQTSAIHTLGYLATVPGNKMLMVQHKNGAVLDALLRVVKGDQRAIPHQIGINATRIIGSLTCQPTASQIGQHTSLLVTLSSLALCRDKLAITAAMTLKKIATYVRSSDGCHEQILQALVTMSFSRAAEVLKWTVKAFFEQSCFPGDRLRMIAHKGLLATLTMLTKDNNDSVRMYAMEVLSSLASK